MEKKRGLGRNLQALLGTKDGAPEAASLAVKRVDGDKLCHIAVDKLQPGKYQPRTDFIPERLQELADSIKSQGVVQPLVVRALASGDKYEIVAGERRWRAAKMAGLEKVPVVIRELSEQAALAIAIIENLQRENLNPIEQAVALQRLQTEFSLTQQEVAEVVGKSRSSVANLLRLMNLEPSVRIFLEHGDIEQGHAKVLLGLQGKAQIDVANEIIAKQWNVRDAEAYVQDYLESVDNSVGNSVGNSVDSLNNSEKKAKSLSINDIPELKRLSQRLQARLQIKTNARGKGKLVISYQNEEDLSRIISLLS